MYLLYIISCILLSPISCYIFYNDKNITYTCINKNAINIAICYDNNVKFCIINDKNGTYIQNISNNNKTIIINNLIYELFINKVLFCYDNYIFLIYDKYVFKYENKIPLVFKKYMNLTKSIPSNILTIDYYDKYFVINKLKKYSKSVLKSFIQYYKKQKKGFKIKCKKKIPIYTYNDVLITENLYIIVILVLILFIIFIAYIK